MLAECYATHMVNSKGAHREIPVGGLHLTVSPIRSSWWLTFHGNVGQGKRKTQVRYVPVYSIITDVGQRARTVAIAPERVLGNGQVVLKPISEHMPGLLPTRVLEIRSVEILAGECQSTERGQRKKMLYACYIVLHFAPFALYAARHEKFGKKTTVLGTIFMPGRGYWDFCRSLLFNDHPLCGSGGRGCMVTPLGWPGIGDEQRVLGGHLSVGGILVVLYNGFRSRMVATASIVKSENLDELGKGNDFNAVPVWIALVIAQEMEDVRRTNLGLQDALETLPINDIG
jgi:hypothetical protein